MQVLLIATTKEDYLQDSIIHGFKQLLGKTAYDTPVKNMLYSDFDEMETIRGNGFSLYGLLDESLKPDKISDLKDQIKNNFFDKIIFTSIFRQYELFYELYPLLKAQKQKVWLMDGEDTDMLFPYVGRFLKKAYFLNKIRPHQHFIYFKRELTFNTIRSYYYRLIPAAIARKLKVHKNIRPIAFSIPDVKVVSGIPVKTKLFTEHIVDADIASHIAGKNTGYAFNTEAAYYADIQQSKFGVTTKRAGWDCLRHYEIAANGAVMCFKNLESKDELCAPHGLISGYNCIAYSDYNDLMGKINSLSDEDYKNMLVKSMEWAKHNTTISRVQQLLNNN